MRAGILFREARSRVANRCAETRVVLISNAADASFDFVGILLIEIFYDIEFHVAPAFGSKSIYRVNITDRFQRFAHQDQAFLFDLDDASSGMCVRLQRMTADRARSR